MDKKFEKKLDIGIQNSLEMIIEQSKLREALSENEIIPDDENNPPHCGRCGFCGIYLKNVPFDEEDVCHNCSKNH